MKNYQLHFFTALLVFLLCFTSCTRDAQTSHELMPESSKLDLTDAEIIGLTTLVPPKGLVIQAGEEHNSYYQQLTKEQIALYQENEKILNYLESFGEKDRIWEAMDDGASLAEMDLTPFLSADQLRMIAENEPIAESRLATCWIEVFRCLVCNGSNYQYVIWECCSSGGPCNSGPYRTRVEELSIPCSGEAILWCTG